MTCPACGKPAADRVPITVVLIDQPWPTAATRSVVRVCGACADRHGQCASPADEAAELTGLSAQLSAMARSSRVIRSATLDPRLPIRPYTQEDLDNADADQ